MSKHDKTNQIVVLGLTLIATIGFFVMLRPFLVTLLLAAIFAALMYPLYERLRNAFRGRSVWAALLSVLLVFCIGFVPLIIFLGILSSQAITFHENMEPLLQRLNNAGSLRKILESNPWTQQLIPYRDKIFDAATSILQYVGQNIFKMVSVVTRQTLGFFFQLFVFLYTLFFFFLDGPKILAKVLYYLPLKDRDERKMLGLFLSVTRAMLKGLVVIAILQGILAGLAYTFFGIENAFLWGSLTGVASLIPGIGTALIWVPAAALLILGGEVANGIGLAIFCALVVGSVDNFLRPKWVGREAKMHELLIFFGVLGGLPLFGFAGLILGPILAALFMSVLALYGEVLRDYLPRPPLPPHD